LGTSFRGGNEKHKQQERQKEREREREREGERERGPIMVVKIASDKSVDLLKLTQARDVTLGRLSNKVVISSSQCVIAKQTTPSR